MAISRARVHRVGSRPFLTPFLFLLLLASAAFYFQWHFRVFDQFLALLDSSMTTVLESLPIPRSFAPHTAVSSTPKRCLALEGRRSRADTRAPPLTLAPRISSAKSRQLIVSEAQDTATKVPRRHVTSFILSSLFFSQVGFHNIILAVPSVGFREYIDTFDGYAFKYPQNWIQVRGAGADIFFRDPFVLDENLSVELSSPSSSQYKSVEDLGPPEAAGQKVLKQYLTEFMSTRLGVRRESNILSTSSTVADDGRLYYQVEVNIKSYANNNELAVMPQDRIVRLEWDRHYFSVLGVENNRLYELRLQTPESVFLEEEDDLRRVMDSFRVIKVAG